MRGSKKSGPVKKRVMRNGGITKKSGPMKKRGGGGISKKSGPAKIKGMRSGGRNLRDEEARVIGVQDNAADEMRRVKARRPMDAAERRDKRDQLARVGSRERNARDEMDRLRREAVGMGMNTGGKTIKKMASGSQTRADRLDERLGNIDGRESTKSQSYGSRRNESNAMTRGAVPRSKTNSPSTKRQGNMLINQHKRMAMGQDVLLAKGGKAPSTTAVNIDMGEPKTKTVKARGMGAAIKGGNFRENT